MMRRGPWSADQLALIQAHQDGPRALTCPNGCGAPMEVGVEQLVCPACGYWQKWVPAALLDPESRP